MMLVIDQAASGQDFNLSPGQIVELRLPENPTTGFRWKLISDPTPACKLLSDSFAAAGNRPGQGGNHTWTLQAEQKGECFISLTYQRSFEPSAAAQSFTVRLHVGDRG